MLFSDDCSLKMLFPFVWILLLCSTASLQSLARFNEPPVISPGRVETSIRRGGQLRCSFVANLLQYLHAKNYQNIMRFDNVTAKTERVQFFCPTFCGAKKCHPFCFCSPQCTRSLLNIPTLDMQLDNYNRQVSQFSISLFSYCILVSHFSVSLFSVFLLS